MFGFSSRGCAVINSHTFTICGSRKVERVKLLFDLLLPNSEGRLQQGRCVPDRVNWSLLQFGLARGDIYFLQVREITLSTLILHQIYVLFVSEVVDTVLRCLARITCMLIEKELSTGRKLHILKAAFICSTAVWHRTALWGWILLCSAAFCPWLCRREPSQCWWVWVDGEWQAVTLPVNQQGCLDPLLHSPGDKICVIFPWGISLWRCLYPPSTLCQVLPTPLCFSLLVHLHCSFLPFYLYGSPLFSPVHWFSQLSSSTAAAYLHLLLFPVDFLLCGFHPLAFKQFLHPVTCSLSLKQTEIMNQKGSMLFI